MVLDMVCAELCVFPFLNFFFKNCRLVKHVNEAVAKRTGAAAEVEKAGGKAFQRVTCKARRGSERRRKTKR